MIEIDPRNLSRAQRRKLQNSKSFGSLAEELVAEEYDLSEFNDAGWYDCHDEDTGAKYEVKSTSSEIGDKYPSTGRFRLWQDNHRSLAASNAQGTAWYAFVYLHERDGLIKIRRREPQTVTRIVHKRGGWDESGHERGERQKKLPPSAVLY